MSEGATERGTRTVAPERGVGRLRPPLVLLADSTPLFRTDHPPLVKRMAAWLDEPTPRAAYLGASNGDKPAFYALFESAMDAAGLMARRMIPARPSPRDRAWLADARVIVLAGGDVLQGWRAFVDSGLDDAIRARHHDGALLIGISAGAIQLGAGTWLGRSDAGRSDAGANAVRDPSPAAGAPARARSLDGGRVARPAGLLTTFGFSPHLYGAHDEANDWRALRRGLRDLGGDVRGYGLPWGGGLLAYPDGSLEPIGPPVPCWTHDRGHLVAGQLTAATAS